MSRPQYGNDMDRPSTGDIIRRARERAEAGLPRESYNTFLKRQAELTYNTPPSSTETTPTGRPPLDSPDSGSGRRLQAPPGLQNKDGQITLPISRPAPVAQWPLAGPLGPPVTQADTEPYRPPAGSSPPPRPPRPRNVPSILDASRIQEHTPVFQYQPYNNNRESETNTSSVPETPSTLSRPSTLSSVGSIPDFPLPIQVPPSVGPSRRSVSLGPPPSSRRGASSFYSHLSYVSPIPEESPRSRSRTSYASSAAMPESWGTPSPMDSPRYGDAFFDDTILEEERSPSEGMSMQSMQSAPDEDDEQGLVRSASVGRRGKAALVTTPSREMMYGDMDDMVERPLPTPLQMDPFPGGTGYLDASSNSSTTVPSTKTAKASPVGAPMTAEAVFFAYDASSPIDPRASRRMSTSPNPMADPQDPRGYSRLSAIRRPPRLDMDAVKQAESRGSLTSLPDLIRRATRLAASLDRGRRPASRFDLDDFPAEFYGVPAGYKTANVGKESEEYYDDKHQSGLSDMLAAFPPPVQQSRTSIRQSLRESVLSWPLPPLNGRPNNVSNGSPRGPGPSGLASENSTSEPTKKGRRCCGLPLWGFILILIIIIILIAAAVIIPVEFFVLRRQGASANTQAAADQQCKNQLTCQNGGTNIVTNGICSCICTNGFTGFDCSTADSAGCTTTTISGDTNINNATVGDAIPRLLSQAAANFSVTLSGSAIISKLNAGNLSCTSENALVTFNGQTTRLGAATDVVASSDLFSGTTANELVQAAVVDNDNIATITVMAGQSTTTTLTISITDSSIIIAPTTTVTITQTFTSTWAPSTTVTSTIATSTLSPSTFSTSTSTTASPAQSSAATFTVTEQVLDFARVGVLFILQQDTLSDASTAQSTLQTFFGSTTNTIAKASNISLSNGNSIDLVNFHIDAGTGLVGSKTTSAKRNVGLLEMDLWDQDDPYF